MMSIYVWSVLFENGTSKLYRTEDIGNIFNYSDIETNEVISVTRVGYASVLPEKEEWIWC